jgi:hypothetical protein
MTMTTTSSIIVKPRWPDLDMITPPACDRVY